jgi:hypothetical protein
MTIRREPKMASGGDLIQFSQALRSEQETERFSEQQFRDFFRDVVAGGQRLASDIGGHLLPFLERFETAHDRG